MITAQGLHVKLAASTGSSKSNSHDGTITGTELLRKVAFQMSEQELAMRVHELFDLHQWRWTHFRPARKADGSWSTAIEGMPGWFDEVAMRRGRMILAELKRESTKQTDDQIKWWDAAMDCQVDERAPLLVDPYESVERTVPEVYLWRPSDLLSGAIERVLR